MKMGMRKMIMTVSIITIVSIIAISFVLSEIGINHIFTAVPVSIIIIICISYIHVKFKKS